MSSGPIYPVDLWLTRERRQPSLASPRFGISVNLNLGPAELEDWTGELRDAVVRHAADSEYLWLRATNGFVALFSLLRLRVAKGHDSLRVGDVLNPGTVVLPDPGKNRQLKRLFHAIAIDADESRLAIWGGQKQRRTPRDLLDGKFERHKLITQRARGKCAQLITLVEETL